jgi:hypothetical protein
MTAACWWLGRKYYPVNYNWLRMGGYVAFSLGVYAGSALLAQWAGYGLYPKLAVNTVLMLGFFGVVWKLERKGLAALG